MESKSMLRNRTVDSAFRPFNNWLNENPSQVISLGKIISPEASSRDLFQAAVGINSNCCIEIAKQRHVGNRIAIGKATGVGNRVTGADLFRNVNFVLRS